MPKAIPFLILALLLSACMAFWGWGEASEARGLLKDQIELREAAEKRLRTTIGALRTVETNNAKLRSNLDRALRQNPEWSATPVPAAVSNSLCKRGKCRPVDPVRTPGD